MRRIMYNKVRDLKGSCQQRRLRHLHLQQGDYAFIFSNTYLAELLSSVHFGGFGQIRFFSVLLFVMLICSFTVNILRAEILPGTDIFKWTIDTRGHSQKAECAIRTRIHILGSCSPNILQWHESNSLHHIHKYFMMHSCLCMQCLGVQEYGVYTGVIHSLSVIQVLIIYYKNL